MKSLKTIKKFLKSEFELSANQLKYELNRFVRYPDVGNELAYALNEGSFPSDSVVSAEVDGITYTAKGIYQNKYGSTVYASYSLLTQIMDNPQIAIEMTKGFKIK